MSKAVQVVGELYEAFGRGDVPAILERLSDDVEWDVFDDDRGEIVPWLKGSRGDKDAIAGFFAIAGSWEMREFSVTALGGDDRMAVAEIVIEAVTPNGTLRDEEAHVWHVGEDGKVTRFRHYLDVRKHAAVA
jgi:ketosteroid isomerase-like protein